MKESVEKEWERECEERMKESIMKECVVKKSNKVLRKMKERIKNYGERMKESMVKEWKKIWWKKKRKCGERMKEIIEKIERNYEKEM